MFADSDFTPEITERFWSKVDTTGKCWLWTAGRTASGYGKFTLHRRQVPAHRYAYWQLRGPIPEGYMVCHHCDNPPCVRPDHLFLGTAKDNAVDMVAKGRSLVGEKNPSVRRRIVNPRPCLVCGKVFKPKSHQVKRGQGKWCSRSCMGVAQRGENNPNKTGWLKITGERNPNAKLTEIAVREIRAAYVAGGVSQAVLAKRFGVTKALIRNILKKRLWKHIA